MKCFLYDILSGLFSRLFQSYFFIIKDVHNIVTINLQQIFCCFCSKYYINNLLFIMNQYYFFIISIFLIYIIKLTKFIKLN